MGIQLHDQTLRDGHQSLLATRLRTEDMVDVAPLMDEVASSLWKCGVEQLLTLL